MYLWLECFAPARLTRVIAQVCCSFSVWLTTSWSYHTFVHCVRSLEVGYCEVHMPCWLGVIWFSRIHFQWGATLSVASLLGLGTTLAAIICILDWCSFVFWSGSFVTLLVSSGKAMLIGSSVEQWLFLQPPFAQLRGTGSCIPLPSELEPVAVSHVEAFSLVCIYPPYYLCCLYGGISPSIQQYRPGTMDWDWNGCCLGACYPAVWPASTLWTHLCLQGECQPRSGHASSRASDDTCWLYAWAGFGWDCLVLSWPRGPRMPGTSRPLIVPVATPGIECWCTPRMSWSIRATTGLSISGRISAGGQGLLFPYYLASDDQLAYCPSLLGATCAGWAALPRDKHLA